MFLLWALLSIIYQVWKNIVKYIYTFRHSPLKMPLDTLAKKPLHSLLALWQIPWLPIDSLVAGAYTGSKPVCIENGGGL